MEANVMEANEKKKIMNAKADLSRTVARQKKKEKEDKELDEKIGNIIEIHNSNLEFWEKLKKEKIGKPIYKEDVLKMRENGITFDSINKIVQSERYYQPREWINNVLKNPYNFAICCPHKLTFNQCEKIRSYEELKIPDKLRSYVFLQSQLTNGFKNRGFTSPPKTFLPYWKIKKSYKDWCETAPMIPLYEQIDMLSYCCEIDKIKHVTSVYFYEMEREIENFLESLTVPDDFYYKTMRSDIEKIAQKEGIKLNIKQVQACVKALTEPLSIIYGPGGTGKSTIINMILKTKKEGRVILCAPTGLAAQGLSNKTRKDVYTLHKYFWTKKLFYSQHPELNPNNKNREYNQPKSVLLIIDEMSMVDTKLFYIVIDCLKDFVNNGIILQIVLAGDPEQLQPIGMGKPFYDLINHSEFPKTELTEVMRQEKKKLLNSLIQIRNQEIPNEHEDFVVHDCKATEFEKELESLINEYNYEIGKDCQVLTAQKKYLGGTHQLNLFLQNLLNPNGSKIKCINETCLNHKYCKTCNREPLEKGKELYEFREGDRILQNKNDYSKEIYNDMGFEEAVQSAKPCAKCADKKHCALECPDAEKDLDQNGIRNGMLGEILQIIKRKGRENLLIVKFDVLEKGLYVRFTLKEANKYLIPSFCLTVDKYQGSEIAAEITIMSPQHTRWTRGVGHQLLYTAKSRAKKRCHTIGKKKFLHQVSIMETLQQEFTSLFQNREFLDLNQPKNTIDLNEFDYLIYSDDDDDSSDNTDEESPAVRGGWRKCETCEKYTIDEDEPSWKKECPPCYRSGLNNKDMNRQCEDCLKFNIKRSRPTYEKRCWPCYKQFRRYKR